MDRNGEDAGVIVENCSGAIAVMNVGIDDHGFLDGAIGLQAAHGDGDIVDGAETFAVISVGVMEAAAQVRTEAIAERALSSKDGASRSEPDRFGELRRIRDFELHDFAGGESAGL